MTLQLATRAPARDLELALGDPFNPGSSISFRRLVEYDEREEAPSAAFDALRESGAYSYLVPEMWGGRLRTFEELLLLVRVVSRRDLVLTTGLGSSALAAIPVWAWGHDDQRRQVADLLLDGAFGSFAVSERGAGSDFHATTTRAEPIDGGYRLSGEKWLIGNASRCSFVVALVQTPTALSLLFLRPDQLAVGAIRVLPRIRTLGLRGHDMGGLAFDACPLPAGALLGRAGRGMEMVLTTLLYTRTMIGGMALGAADTALRLALGWGHERHLYGKSILAIPAIRALLLRSFLDILIAECVVTVTARALTLAPRRTVLWAAITKYLVPNLCERVVRDALVVLSARSYLREGVGDGILQKIARDIAITSIFEGTQLVQLALIESLLARPGPRDPEHLDLDRLCDLGTPAPAWDPMTTGLRIAAPGGDELVERWGEGKQAADARHHCVLHAAACCRQVWLTNRDRLGGEWLTLCLDRLSGGSDWMPSGADLHGPVFDQMLGQYERNELFSLLPLELA